MKNIENVQMTSDLRKNEIGEVKTRPLRQSAERLTLAANGDSASDADVPRSPLGSPHASLAAGLKHCEQVHGGLLSCAQKIWFSFFFDGTGNNLDADLDSKKHSNIAKLYRVHRGEDSNGNDTRLPTQTTVGIYRIYVPGIGTYFPDINDVGGTDAGLGAGAFGDARISWAIGEFESKMRKHAALAKNPKNQILEINIAAFGFSRGAALARAFIHDFVKNICASGNDKKLYLKNGKHLVRIRFLGLLDTVASVGLAMSANNMEKIDAVKGSTLTHISTRLAVHHETRPVMMAFHAEAKPGADPAPGNYDGHAEWGKRLIIPEVVENVRHFVAGHEVRNSFPVDSISVLGENGFSRLPSGFFEYVYPGVHSDVGGSYRPGEGGKNERFNTKLGLVPLKAMYDFSIAAGVPMTTKEAWSAIHHEDFSADAELIEDFEYYLKKLPVTKKNLGSVFSAHMQLYYAWRFYKIARKRAGDVSEADSISRNEAVFGKEGVRLSRKIRELEAQLLVANANLNVATWNRDEYMEMNDVGPERTKRLNGMNQKIKEANLSVSQAKDNLLREKAVQQALPKTDSLVAMIKLYDTQLMIDAQAIYDVMSNPRLGAYQRGFKPGWSTLRPHYKILMQAYKNEFIDQRGLRDERLLDFFDKYVHDSLAGFGKDATLPSDPRVIYVGGDEKLKYANNRISDHEMIGEMA